MIDCNFPITGKEVDSRGKEFEVTTLEKIYVPAWEPQKQVMPWRVIGLAIAISFSAIVWTGLTLLATMK